MSLWVLFMIFVSLFVVSFVNNRHSFSNAIFFSISVLLIISIAYFTHVNRIRMLPLAVMLGFILLCALLVSFMFIFAGITSIKKEGLSLPHVLSIAFGVFYWSFVIVAWYVFFGDEFTLVKQGLTLFIMLAVYILYTFTSLFLYSMFYRILPKNKNCDFIIVHGAGLLDGYRVSPLLAGRLEKGIEIYEKSGQKANIIVSGGKGSDEQMSEAEAMKNYLIENGIDEKHIVLENKSRNTLENLSFSKKIMDDMKENYSCIFVTSDYHVFRTGNYAKKVGLKIDGVGCKTAFYYWPNAFIREYIALMLKYKKALIVLVVIWALGIIFGNLLF